MTSILRQVSLILVLCTSASMASAVSLNLNFDQFDDEDTPASGDAAGAPAGPVSFINTNHGLYDAYLPSILLGDDGWESQISFDANFGYTFSATSVRFVGGLLNVWTAPVSGAVDPSSPYDQLTHAQQTNTLERADFPYIDLIGYRNGAVVASQEANFAPGPAKTVDFNSNFVDLDRLVVSLDFGNADAIDPQIVGNRLFYCPNERCGTLKFDDLLLNVEIPGNANPSTVPLPAPLLMLGAACFGLAGFGRRARTPLK